MERYIPMEEEPFVIRKPAYKPLEELKAIVEHRILGTDDPIEVLFFRRGKGLWHTDSDNGLGYAQNLYRNGDNPEILVDEFARKMQASKRVEIRPLSS